MVPINVDRKGPPHQCVKVQILPKNNIKNFLEVIVRGYESALLSGSIEGFPLTLTMQYIIISLFHYRIKLN